jgi:hypothetical protein
MDDILQLCSAGDLYALMSVKVGAVSKDDVLSMLWAAGDGGHCDVLQWLLENFDCSEYAVDALTAVCVGGHLPAAKLIVTHLPITSIGDYLANPLSVACHGNHQAVVEWLFLTFGPFPESVCNAAFIRACKASALATARWLAWRVPFNKKTVLDALRGACAEGRLSVVQWLAIDYKLSGADLRALVPCDDIKKIRTWLLARIQALSH